MPTALSKPFRHINVPFYHLKNLIDFKLMTDKIIQACTGNKCLYIMYTFQQISLPVAVQFRKHIIKKKHGGIFDLFFDQI